MKYEKNLKKPLQQSELGPHREHFQFVKRTGVNRFECSQCKTRYRIVSSKAESRAKMRRR